MTEMRRRMEEELKLRGCSPRTQKAYVEWVARFARHHCRAPEQMGEDQVRAYLLYLLEDQKLSRSTLVQALCRAPRNSVAAFSVCSAIRRDRGAL